MVVRTWLGAASALALAGCFNPPQLSPDDTTADTSADTTSPTSSTAPVTLDEPTTTAPVCNCAQGTYCLMNSGCGDCNDLEAEGSSCAALDPNKPACQDGTGLCVECVTAGDCANQVCHPEQSKCVDCLTSEDCKDPARPRCDEPSNTCTACTDNSDCSLASAAICDENTGQCRACNQQSDCPATACDLLLGICFPPQTTTVLYVDGNLCDSMQPPVCTKIKPCCEIAEAVTIGEATATTNVAINIAAGIYEQPVRVSSSARKFALRAANGALLDISDQTQPAFELGILDGAIKLDTAVYISGLTLTGAAARGFSCNNSNKGLFVDRSTVFGLKGQAAYTKACPLTLTRTDIYASTAGVVADDAGNAVLRNVAIAPTADGAALDVSANGAMDLLYTTVGDSSNQPDRILVCGTTANVVIRNSALLASPAVPSDPACLSVLQATHTTFTAGAFNVVAPTNATIAAVLVPDLFVGWVVGNLDLAADGGALAGQAEWRDGDPSTDIDGRPRPTSDLTPDVAGAALPAP